jgi:flagellar M-ring protein FliF
MRRLTVAVVVDNQRSMKDGKEISTPYSDAELERFNNLVKQAVGFDSSRGDQVTVTNAAFLPQDSLEPLPEVPLWERAWFLNLMKLAVALIVVLALVFGVFRPAVRGLQVRQLEALPPPALASPGEEGQEGEDTLALESAEGELAGGELAEDKLTLSSDEPLLLPGGHSYEKRLEFVRKMVDEDPKRVAQVIKGWVTS